MGLQISEEDLSDTTTFFSGNYDVSSVFLTICCALSIYNGLELLLLIFTTFRRFRGLYFWSLLVASSGLLPYTVGLLIMYFTFIDSAAGLIITCFGWPMLVTGQSFVLYSRLHVVLGRAHHKILNGVKWMIIIDGVAFHISTEVVLFGAYYAPQGTGFAAAYKYIEKIQMTGFTAQELILSGLYVWKTLDIIRATPSGPATCTALERKKHTSRIMWQLFSINVFIVFMDIALLVIEYQDRHVFQQALKGVIYSVKLKLEFAILSKLVALTSSRASAIDAAFSGTFKDYRAHVSAEANQKVAQSGKPFHGKDLLPPGSPSSQLRKDMGDDMTSHIEDLQDCSVREDMRQCGLVRLPTRSTSSTGLSSLEQRNRHTLDEDLYGRALRGMS